MSLNTKSANPESDCLLLIDVQTGFDDPYFGDKRNNPQAEETIAALLQHWRHSGGQVIHVQHCSLLPDSPLHPDHQGCSFKPEAAPLPGEMIFQKSVNSGFIGTGLEGYLRQNGITNLCIVGLTTDHCVSTTTRMAGNLGFATTVVEEATATFGKTGFDGVFYSADTLHRAHLTSLDGEFCTVVSAKAILQ